VIGWTPDGKHILFRSTRAAYSRYTQLFTVAPEGGVQIGSQRLVKGLQTWLESQLPHGRR
jgi:Tol biopolymer transport system component